jgi:hypothetical protein
MQEKETTSGRERSRGEGGGIACVCVRALELRATCDVRGGITPESDRSVQ